MSYTKDRFERDDPAWSEMVRVVRGEEPLRPIVAKQRGYEGNDSPLYRLYQAFRRSSPQGKNGLWSRVLVVKDNDRAQQMAALFDDDDPDYLTDDRWWQLVLEQDKEVLGEKPGDGGDAALPLDRVWRTISWDRVRDDSSAWVPRVEGFPVTKVQVSQGTTGGMSVVSQQLANGETIRTVAGPASDVSSLLRRQGGQVATASLQEDQRASGRATGDRMLVIMGDVPADSLRAFLLRVR